MNKVFLVSCVGKKLSVKSKANNLYQSPWFKKAKIYAQKTGDKWYILSAKYGMVHPKALLEPYELTLNMMSKDERQRWAEQVLNIIKIELDPKYDEIIILAGKRYREFLVPWLEAEGFTVWVLMRGLGIGQQLKWLGERIR